MLSTTTNTAEYIGNGVATNFNLPARVEQASHLSVQLYEILTGVTVPVLPSEYTVTGYGLDTGVDVTYPLIGAPLAATHKLILDRVLPIQQNTSFGTHSGWSAEQIEEQFDYITMVLQQLQTNVDRNIYGPDAGAIASAAIAAAALFLPKAGGIMTGPIQFKAGTAGSAPAKFPTGVAPAAPTQGEVWATATEFKAFLGTTLTVVFLEEVHVWGVGKQQSFTHDAGSPGLRVVPAANDPGGLSNGATWYNSVTGRWRGRIEGVSLDVGFPGLNAETLGQVAGVNDQAGAYQFVLLDAGYVVRSTGAGAQTFTIPADATIAFPIKTYITILQYGAGQITLAAAGGVTLRSSGGKTKSASQYSAITLLKVATNEWIAFGDMTT